MLTNGWHCERAHERLGLDLDDIQGLIARGYCKLPYASYVLLRHQRTPVSARSAFSAGGRTR